MYEMGVLHDNNFVIQFSWRVTLENYMYMGLNVLKFIWSCLYIMLFVLQLTGKIILKKCKSCNLLCIIMSTPIKWGVCPSVCPSHFRVRSISFELFTNNSAQMSIMMSRCAVRMFDQGRVKVKHCSPFTKFNNS